MTINYYWTGYKPEFLGHIAETPAVEHCLKLIREQNPATVMEVGIGGSQFMEQLMGFHPGDYIGVDGTPSFIDFGKSKNIPRTSYVCGLMGKAEAPVADLIYLRHVLEHNPDLNECARWLAEHTRRHVLVVNFLDWLPKGESLHIGRRRISCTNRSRRIFVDTFRDNGLTLQGDWVFRQPKLFERVLLFAK